MSQAGCFGFLSGLKLLSLNSLVLFKLMDQRGTRGTHGRNGESQLAALLPNKLPRLTPAA